MVERYLYQLCEKSIDPHFLKFFVVQVICVIFSLILIHVPTQLELQKMKKEIVGSFSSSLKPSYTIQHLWYTARCFKNCVIPSLRPDNDVWFESFCSKIAPYYISNKSEIFPCYTPSDCLHYVLTNNFNLSE